jgi:hypothetical protein
MGDEFTNRTWQTGRKDAGSAGARQQPPRIQIDVPMGTSYQEIQESIFRQAWQLAGTQLRAAIALGITPDTLSRVLRRSDRRKFACPQVPETWPVVTSPEPPPDLNRVIKSSGHRANVGQNPSSDQQISGEQSDRAIGSSGRGAIDGEDPFSVSRTAAAENDSEESGPALDTNNDDTERDDW